MIIDLFHRSSFLPIHTHLRRRSTSYHLHSYVHYHWIQEDSIFGPCKDLFRKNTVLASIFLIIALFSLNLVVSLSKWLQSRGGSMLTSVFLLRKRKQDNCWIQWPNFPRNRAGPARCWIKCSFFPRERIGPDTQRRHRTLGIRHIRTTKQVVGCCVLQRKYPRHPNLEASGVSAARNWLRWMGVLLLRAREKPIRHGFLDWAQSLLTSILSLRSILSATESITVCEPILSKVNPFSATYPPQSPAHLSTTTWSAKETKV